MKISKKSATLGGIMIAFACIVFFIGFFALLFVPIQDAYISKNLANGTHNQPSWIVFGLFSAVVGFLFGAFTNIGYQMTKAKSFNIEYPDLHLHDVLGSKKFLLWSLFWAIAFVLLVEFAWRGQI